MNQKFSNISSFHILDSKQAKQFDELLNIACKICNTECGYISFIDGDRQWLKSRAGINYTEIPYDNSLCSYMVDNDFSHLYIPDITAQNSYTLAKSNPKYGAKFFASYSIRTDDNCILGNFVVFDYVPKKLNDVQLEFLKTMASQTLSLVESNKLNVELTLQTKQLDKRRIVTDKAASIGKIGGLYLDLNNENVFWTPFNNHLFDFETDYSMGFNEFTTGLFKFKNSALPLFQEIRHLSFSLDDANDKFTFEFNINGKIIKINIELSNAQLYIVFQDKSAERKLNHELNMYSVLMEKVEKMVNLGGWSFDLNTNELFWTKNIYKIHDLPTSEKINIDKVKSHFSSEDNEKMAEDFLSIIETGKSIANEYLLTTSKGYKKWVNASYHPLYTEGKISHILGSLQDVSDKKRLIEELEQGKNEAVEASKHYKSLVNNSTFYICNTTLEGRITFCNDFYISELGIPTEEVLIQDVDIFASVDSEFLDLAQKAFKSVATGMSDKTRILVKEKNSLNKDVNIIWEFIGIENCKNKLSEVLCLGYDVTELEENRAQIQILADHTSFQNKKLLEYNSIVSHDIRSHVANALGLISLMDFHNELEEQQNYFQLLKGEIKKTDRTLIGLDRLTSAKSIFETGKEPIHLFQLIESTIAHIRTTIPHRIFRVANRIPENLILLSAKTYLQKMLTDILTNCLKYKNLSHDHCIEIDVYQIASLIFQIKISDNGICIDLDRYKQSSFKIKRPLRNIKDDRELDLFLIRQHIEKMGGRVHIQSEKDKGTTIVLEFLNYAD